MKRTPDIQCPFVVLVDFREGAPYTFEGIRGDSRQGYKPIRVLWRWAHLKTGDYSIEGLENRVAIERKSLEDLYGTLGQRREQFEAEHRRLSALDFGAVVIEASWSRILRGPPPRSKLHPRSVYRTGLVWQMRYRIPWFTADNRRLAELTTFRLLEKYFESWKRGKRWDGGET